MRLRPQILSAIFWRNFSSYFSGVLGYLFIVVFVVAGGAFAFNARFFTANEPGLDQLTQYFPLLLLFFVPAITMTVWADERKLGTDELLFTMPMTDIEILIGKYLSVLAVYSVALLFSTTHVFVLAFLGNPDWGLIATTYFGYWIAGAALLSAGMLASCLTSAPTVAFILGVLLCSLPVFIERIGAAVGHRELFAEFSLSEQFRDFGMGVIPFDGLLYFIAFTALMLYLNLVMVTRRHWARSRGIRMGWQYAIRTVCLGIMLSCATAWAGFAALRVDATSERLFSLSSTTRDILDKLDSERPIEIQAFLSPEVPREYADTRKQLVGLLRQFDEIGGRNLQVRHVDVTPFSRQADEAEHFGIEPQQVMTEIDGRRTEVEFYLGAVVISSYDKVVIPFFGKGLPIEYELTRSVQTVAQENRLTVGILNTDANLMGGSREWQIVTELKKQYDVEEVSPSSEIDAERFDVLLAVMPSSLTEEEMDHFVKYVNDGHPVMIFDDPFPLAFNSGFGVTNAPRQPKPRAGGHMGMFGGNSGPPPEQKADGGRATRLLDALNIAWQYDEVVFDVNNPHPEFGMLPAEYVFITRYGNNPEAFNTDAAITKGLQEVIAIYSGTIKERMGGDRNVEFTRLLTTGAKSGLLGWNDFVDDGNFNFFSMQSSAQPKRNPFRVMDEFGHVIAAHIKSNEENDQLNAVFVADVDMISDFFFQERNLGNLDIEFDNVTFVLNAIDTLAGDESFINLRSRRARHRSLQRVESARREFLQAANEAEQKADAEAEKELDARREQLGKRLKEIRENKDLDPIAQAQLERQAQEAEQQRLALAEAQIEDQKNRQIGRIHNETKQKIEKMESSIQLWAVWLPPIPALCVGLIVFARRVKNERDNIVPSRRRDISAISRTS